jgi:hypothetical protein
MIKKLINGVSFTVCKTEEKMIAKTMYVSMLVSQTWRANIDFFLFYILKL